MTIYSIKPLFQKTLAPAAKLFVMLKIHPTIINFLALFASIAAGVMFLFIERFHFFLFIIPALLFIRIAFNALDGMVARELKVSSVNGEIYNEFIDRLSDCSIFILFGFSFIVCYSLTDINAIWEIYHQFVLTFIFIILFLLNSYVGILAKAAGKSRIYTGFIGKADRMFYLGLSCLIFYFYNNPAVWTVFLIFVIAGTIISLGHRICKAVK